MNKITKFVIGSCTFSALSITSVYAAATPSSSYVFPLAPSPNNAYQTAITAPSGSPTLTAIPNYISDSCYSPMTTDYSQVSYDIKLGTIYRTSSQRDDILDCVKNFNLSNIGINRTISEVLGALTPNFDGTNSACGWFKDSQNANGVICSCGNYKVYFDCYATSEGMDIYASVSNGNQGIITYSESDLINFFKNLDVQITNIENSKKETENDKNSTTSNIYYNNSIVVNGNNSGTIIYNK